MKVDMFLFKHVLSLNNQGEGWTNLKVHAPSSLSSSDEIEKVVEEAYHKEDGMGWPPRKPRGMFKA
jgi:hypothetical protein